MSKIKYFEERERRAQRNKVKMKKHLEIYGGLGEYDRWVKCPHSRMNYAKRLKLRPRVEDLGLPERKTIYISSREAEDVGSYICPCRTTTRRRTYTVARSKIYKEEQDAFEEGMRTLDVCDLDELGRLERVTRKRPLP